MKDLKLVINGAGYIYIRYNYYSAAGVAICKLLYGHGI